MAVVGGSLQQPLIPPLSVALSLAITGVQPSIEETSLHVATVAIALWVQRGVS